MLLVHGEAERNDMVEYFGKLLDVFKEYQYPNAIGQGVFMISTHPIYLILMP